MAPPTIREAGLSDLSTIVRFTLALAKEMNERINRKVIYDGVTQFITEGNHGKYFLASLADTLVGQVVIKPVILEPWKKSRIIWVDDFYISPLCLNGNILTALSIPEITDIMKALLKHGIAWAVPNEHEQVVRLYCPHHHPNMLHSMLSLGFEPIGIMMQQRQDYFFKPQKAAVTIREGTLADVNQLTYFTVNLATSLGDEVNQKLIRDGITAFITADTYGKYFLAELDGRPAGQMIVKNTLLEPWKRSRVIWIDDAYADDGCRGQGVIRALLERGIAWASASEPEQIVRLYCAFKNHAGLLCWTGLGFEPIGYLMQQRQDVFL